MVTTPRPAPISIRNPAAEAGVRARTRTKLGAGSSAIAARDLIRYYALLDRSLADVRKRLTEGEALLLCDILNGTLLDENSVRYLWHEVADALDSNPSLEQKWSVAGHGLVDKLQQFSYAELLALGDAVERFWIVAPGSDIHDTVRQVGLVRD